LAEVIDSGNEIFSYDIEYYSAHDVGPSPAFQPTIFACSLYLMKV